MKLNLLVADGVNKGKVIAVTKTQFLIGRDASCQLRPSSPSVSKRHCALLQREGKVFVRDLKSTNGTFVNDKQVSGEVELHNEDRLSIGPLAFVVQLAAPVSVEEPTPLPATKPPSRSKAKAKGKNKALDEDSVADMLLQMDEDEASGGDELLDENIPGGNTLFEIPALKGDDLNKKSAQAEETDEEQPGKYETAKAAKVSTSNAAKDILKQYNRRAR